MKSHNCFDGEDIFQTGDLFLSCPLGLASLPIILTSDEDENSDASCYSRKDMKWSVAYKGVSCPPRLHPPAAPRDESGDGGDAAAYWRL